MLYLTRTDLQGVLNLDLAIEITLQLYRQFATGTAQPLPPRVFTGVQQSLRISGGEIGEPGGIGVRISVSGGRGALAVLFSDTEGTPIAVLEYPFSTLRTAALVAVATRALAPTTASTLAMIGTGDNAPGYCEAIIRVRPIERVLVYSRDAGRRAAFAARVGKQIDIELQAVATLDEAIEDADIVCVATNAREPVLSANGLKPGTFVVSMGSARELDSSVYQDADPLVVSYRPDLTKQTRHLDEAGQIFELIERGTLDWGTIHTLGSMLDNYQPPMSPGGLAVFRDFQTGFGDIALCLAAYRECVARGLGTSIDS